MEKVSPHAPSIAGFSFQGVYAALPLVVAYVPLGIAFGLLAAESQLSLFTTVAMSVLVYTGAAQFIGVSMLAAGDPGLAILMMTVLINARYLLFSMTLAPYLKSWRGGLRFLFGLQITDEVFALQSIKFQSENRSLSEIFGVNITVHLAWISSTTVGHLSGAMIGDAGVYGLDYVLPAIFISFVVFSIRTKVHLIVALAAAATSTAAALCHYASLGLILSTLIAASLGVAMDKHSRSRPSE